jgi:hypothetical protein
VFVSTAQIIRFIQDSRYNPQPIYIMPRRMPFTSRLLLLSLLVQATLSQDNPCQSFGKDFQDGGTYFQNSLSSDPFTFVEYFEGKRPALSRNVNFIAD